MDVLILLAGIVLGSVIAWYIAALRFRQSQVPRSELERVGAELNTATGTLRVEQEKNATLAQSLAAAQESLQRSNTELLELSARNASQQTQLELLEKQRADAKSALDDARADAERRRNEVEELGRHLSTASAQLSTARDAVAAAAEVNARLGAENKEHIEEIAALHKHAAVLEAQLGALEEKLDTQKAEIESMRKHSEAEFKILASQILEEKSSKFTELNRTNLESILKPLGENLAAFKQKVEDVYQKESQERFSLGKEVERLVLVNQKISEEANSLTRALEGNAKTQGDWGEMILESILEKSGLVKGREYLVQEFLRDDDNSILKNDDGSKLQPDVLVMYPDNRKVIVDSKVSLIAYKRYSSAATPEEQAVALKQHVESVKKHVEELSRKNYHDFTQSLDFVMMFIPIEPAYLAAMQYEPELWSFAYSRRVLLISPTNLIVALKLVQDLWQREYQNRNAIDIAERSGALYDKFVLFIETLSDVGAHIDKAGKSYERAMKQLTDGNGNLVTRVEKLKALGAKAKKALPTALVAEAQEIEEAPEEEGNGEAAAEDEASEDQ